MGLDHIGSALLDHMNLEWIRMDSELWFISFDVLYTGGGWWDGSKGHRRIQWHVPAYASDFEMARNSERNWIRGKNDSNFELSQDFRAKKSELFREFDTWSVFRAEIKEKLNGSNFELSQDPHAYAIMWQISFDDFLSYLRVRPVWK